MQRTALLWILGLWIPLRLRIRTLWSGQRVLVPQSFKRHVHEEYGPHGLGVLDALQKYVIVTGVTVVHVGFPDMVQVVATVSVSPSSPCSGCDVVSWLKRGVFSFNGLSSIFFLCQPLTLSFFSSLSGAPLSEEFMVPCRGQ